MLAVEFARLLAFRDHRAVAGASVEGGYARATRANTFRERALRIELDFDAAGHVELLENLILADVGCDDFFDLAVGEHCPHAVIIRPHIVAYDGQSSCPGIAQGGDQILRDTA